MAKGLSPFTRISLLITELNSNRVEDLGNTQRCDLAHHAARMIEDVEDPVHKESAKEIETGATALLAEIRGGRFSEAENQRSQLVTSCKRLKSLL
ncbi:MAG: hypothetical protein IPN69_16910 [Acidobacteria bacterium]|nr:hypothetical protein [Acidobacteriota bacterium]MBK8147052.1 hypothetical protein [Acidobacteriota bacterium]MBK8812392.1 hypothetical protein [Acidobacteriota bacterium]